MIHIFKVLQPICLNMKLKCSAWFYNILDLLSNAIILTIATIYLCYISIVSLQSHDLKCLWNLGYENETTRYTYCHIYLVVVYISIIHFKHQIEETDLDYMYYMPTHSKQTSKHLASNYQATASLFQSSFNYIVYLSLFNEIFSN